MYRAGRVFFERCNALRSTEKGEVLVEAAITFPIVLILGLTTLDISTWMFQHQAMTTGVRDAARYLARVTNPTDTAVAQVSAINIACFGNIDKTGLQPRIPNCAAANITISTPTVTNTWGLRGATLRKITVTASIPYSGWNMLKNFGFDPQGQTKVTVSHTERWIGG